MTRDSEGLHPIANTTSPRITADVVFVHGLIGGSRGTLRHGEGGKEGHFFWPEELGKALPNCAIWSLGYAAGITHWFGATGMAIQARALNLVLKLLNHNLGQHPLIFIIHSMGGLEVKEIIVGSQTRGSAEWKTLVASIRGIVFCGTPHRGADFVTAAKVLSSYLRTQEHVQQMKMGASGLDTLHDEFIMWQRTTGIMVESYVEQIGLVRTWRWLRFLPQKLVVPTAIPALPAAVATPSPPITSPS
jgi:pimeloyl-ACP methyl ester carboxylesterase